MMLSHTTQHGRSVTRASITTPPDLMAGSGSATQIVKLKDGRSVELRIAHSQDIPAVQEFVRGLSSTSRRNRFFAPIRELSPDQLERVTRSCPPAEVALVCETVEDAGRRIVAMAQYATCEELDAEFAIVVDDTWQRQSLGIQLLGVLADYATHAGLTELTGLVLRDNWPMLALLARFECELITDGDPYVIRAIKRLHAHKLAA